jgi:hypothetical protein
LEGCCVGRWTCASREAVDTNRTSFGSCRNTISGLNTISFAGFGADDLTWLLMVMSPTTMAAMDDTNAMPLLRGSQWYLNHSHVLRFVGGSRWRWIREEGRALRRRDGLLVTGAGRDQMSESVSEGM